MKLRTSFFNETVFRKNISRFAPAWGIYLIGGLLIMLTLLTNDRFDYAAQSLSTTMGPFGIINFIYALIVAQLLFGDLFNSRLCNALHALPLRREAWFGTHVISGLLFSLLPHAIGALLMMPTLKSFWYIALLWWGVMALEYLFFFGIATLSTFLTGNRFAMAAVYAIINFFSIMVMWFVETLYEPLLWGVSVDTEGFVVFSPVVQLATMEDFLVFKRADQLTGEMRILEFDKFGYENWIYLWILAVIGLAALVGALLIYRRRALESAGDFLAVRKLDPVFTVIFSLAAGVVFQSFGDTIFIRGTYVFFVVGLTVGFFAAQMLLERTVKVFQPKRFLRLVILAGALVASLVLTSLDPIGITRYVPDAEDVEVLYLQGFELTDPEDIESAMQIHKKIIAEGEPSQSNLSVNFTYVRKDGSSVIRNYTIYAKSATGQLLKEQFYSRPEYVLDYTDWEQYLDGVEEILINGNELETWNKNGYYPEHRQQLLEAIKADCEAGVMAQQWGYQEGADTKNWCYIDIRYTTSDDGITYCSLRVPPEATNTRKWLNSRLDLWDGKNGFTPSAK